MKEQDFRDKYYSQVSKQTLETLPEFINQLIKDGTGYGSVCCAVAAAALSAAWAVNKKAGITGFQAGAVMWEFIQQWQYKSNKTGLKIVDFDNMLYAQYEDNFQKTIGKSVFESLQKEAQSHLDKDKANHDKYIKDAEQYQKDLAAFVEKYPDYHKRPKHYEKLGCGTGAEWDAEKKKEESGFEFAPAKPFYREGQLDHWQSIVNGIVPFGFEIKPEN